MYVILLKSIEDFILNKLLGQSQLEEVPVLCASNFQNPCLEIYFSNSW